MSPFLTSWPWLKRVATTYPDTRGRTSTLSTASKRPVNSSNSVIDFETTLAAATGGGAAGVSEASLRAQPARIRAASGRMKDEASDDFWSLDTGNLPSGCEGYPPLLTSTAHGPGGAQ